MSGLYQSENADLLGREGATARRDHWWLLGLGGLSLAAHGWLLGARLGGDSGRYLDAARRLLSGQPLVDKQADFLAYDWLVALTGAADGGPWPLMVFQALLSLLAGLALYWGGSRAFGRAAGLAAAAAYLLWPDLQRWNFYLLSDGVFNSLLALALGLALGSTGRPLAWLGLMPVLLLMAFTRPEGLLFWLPVAAWCLVRRRYGLGLSLLALAGLLAIISPLSVSGGAEIIAQWRQGAVVWGHPALDQPPNLAEIEPLDSLPLFLWTAFWLDPAGVAGLMLRRVFWFLVHARPFYSLAHNLAAAVSSLCLLGLALWGALTGRGGGGHRLLPWAVVLLQLLLCALTWADWDGRFLTRVSPALLLLAADGLLGAGDPDFSEGGPGRFAHL
ncbi:MAG: hypothetical protein ACOZHQ_03050 [Thermodesulfobacteriota bacterium]